MDFSQLFSKELIQINGSYQNQQELFSALSTILFDLGYVEASFYSALSEREKQFPTGLQTDMVRLAIPHTDIIYVKKPFIFVCKLKSPITFIQMGSLDEEVAIDTIFMLGIKEPKEQVGLLAEVMQLFRDDQFIQIFQQTNQREEMALLLKNKFRSEAG